MPKQNSWDRDVLPPKLVHGPGAARPAPWTIIALRGALAGTLLIGVPLPEMAMAEQPERPAEFALAALSAKPAVDQARLRSLGFAVAAWVATAMDLPVPAEMPRIAFLDPSDMAELRYGEPAAGAAPEPTVAALYDDDAGTIYLRSGWTGATPVELSVLAHEMTHHLQDLSGRPYDCPASREAEAYALQDRWLGLFGTTLHAEFDLDALGLVMLTRCGPP